MKFLLFWFCFCAAVWAEDTTVVLVLAGKSYTVNTARIQYFDLQDFQNFVNKKLKKYRFTEVLTSDMTGDDKTDTLVNNVYLTLGGCMVNTIIISNGKPVYGIRPLSHIFTAIRKNTGGAKNNICPCIHIRCCMNVISSG